MVVAGLIVAALIADPSAAAVDVTGDSSCPSAAEVAAALPGLIGPTDPDIAADQASLTDDGSAVTVALRRASGDLVGEKRLDAGLSCEQRARAAAVVIAAWEARPGVQANTLAVPAPPPRPAAVVAERSPGDLTARAGPAPIDVEPGASLGASLNGASPAPVAAIEVAFSRRDGLIIPAVGALFVGTHTRSVGPGDGTWRRYGLLATVGSRRSWSAAWAEARVGVAATLLDISGDSYPSNGAGITFDPGITLGARCGPRFGPVRLWIDATAAFWPRGQTLTVSGVPASAALPRGEALLGLGASYAGR